MKRTGAIVAMLASGTQVLLSALYLAVVLSPTPEYATHVLNEFEVSYEEVEQVRIGWIDDVVMASVLSALLLIFSIVVAKSRNKIFPVLLLFVAAVGSSFMLVSMTRWIGILSLVVFGGGILALLALRSTQSPSPDSGPS